MDKKAAAELAAGLQEQLVGKVLRVRAEQINPYSGDASIGWAARVVREDGSVVDVIGNATAGYQITDRTLGWVSFDRIVKDVLNGDGSDATATSDAPADPETSPADDTDLVQRITVVAVKVAELGAELRAIRDELALRSKR